MVTFLSLLYFLLLLVLATGHIITGCYAFSIMKVPTILSTRRLCKTAATRGNNGAFFLTNFKTQLLLASTSNENDNDNENDDDDNDKNDQDDNNDYNEQVKQVSEARLEYFKTLGEPSPMVLAPFLSPDLASGGPGPWWPTRAAWRQIMVRNGEGGEGELNDGNDDDNHNDDEDSTVCIISSDGLSNPWNPKDDMDYNPNKPNQGLGLEVLMVGSTTDISYQAILSTVCQISNTVARDPLRFLHMLQLNEISDREDLQSLSLYTDRGTEYGLLSTEVETHASIYPSNIIDPETNRVGVLLDQGLLTSSSSSSPLLQDKNHYYMSAEFPNVGTIQFFDIVLLYPNELDFVRKCSYVARQFIAQRLRQLRDEYFLSMTKNTNQENKSSNSSNDDSNDNFWCPSAPSRPNCLDGLDITIPDESCNDEKELIELAKTWPWPESS